MCELVLKPQRSHSDAFECLFPSNQRKAIAPKKIGFAANCQKFRK